MNLGLVLSILFACTMLTWAAYSYLKIKYPGKGLQLIENIFKRTMPFNKAIEALQKGSRIRRKLDGKGYTKMTIVEGKHQQEKYGTYWMSDRSLHDYCSFSIDDVLAQDWIIDE